jgi:hypothetical protein
MPLARLSAMKILIQRIFFVCDHAQIAKPVVRPYAVNVVNDQALANAAVDINPCDSVQVIGFFVDVYEYIPAVIADAANNKVGSSAFSWPLPVENSRVRVVVEQFV